MMARFRWNPLPWLIHQLVKSHWIVIVAIGWGFPLFAGDSSPFSTEIAPLFKAHCVKCHGPAKAEGGLNLSLASAAARGGKNGPIVRPHDLENSLLWDRVRTDEMPPKQPLSADEKDRLKKWIIDGAPGLTALPSKEMGEIDHWAFRALKRPTPPSVKTTDRIRTPVDQFVEAALETEGSTLAPEAEKRRLIRRVSLTLTGLPATPEEVDRFLNDALPDAYKRMVDAYLASPRYGERWGKYWLDAVGYADSNGYFNADSDRPLAYRYRDYVIKAINEDRPFDRFLREQLAGDEFVAFTPGESATPEVIDCLVATHFLRNGQDGSGESDGNPDEVRVDRYTALESCAQIVASSLLGLTMQCAKCHAHKFEPISHEDYYQFQAIFDPVFPAAHDALWIKPQARFILAPGPGEKEAWEQDVKSNDACANKLRSELKAFALENRPHGEILFLDDFDSDSLLSSRWSNQAPTDDAPGGNPPVTLDDENAPAARIHVKRLEIIAGKTSDSWISTKQAFDWSPNLDGESIQVTFDLVDNKVSPQGKPAERLGYFIAAHDFDDSDKVVGGNILIDGNPSTSTSIHLDYPGSDSVAKGTIGRTGYVPGRNYGIRISNKGKGEFRLEHLVDGVAESGSVKLSAAELADGGFGFDYHGDRSFVVDNVLVERFLPAPSEAGLKLAQFVEQSERRQSEFEKAEKKLTELKNNPPGKIAWASDVSSTPPATHLLLRGDYSKPGSVTPPLPLSALSAPGAEFEIKPLAGNRTTGRRLAFANWLTNPQERASGLMARVQVNRVWQAHFQTGIVATPENLGISGAIPSHPELLDWLAAEFVESGWSLKHIHRVILNSAIFRQISEQPVVPGTDARLLGHFPVHRLDAEAIRDAMLAVSGDLDQTMGGPHVPFQTRDDGAIVVPESQPGGHRRTVYLRYRRTQVISMLQVFDAPSIVFNSVRRPTTAMPLQSLTLLNSEFVRARATSFAKRLESEQPEEAKRVERSFLMAYSRPPTFDEQMAVSSFLDAQSREYPQGLESRRNAWIDYCQSLLVSNEFLYLD